MVYVYSQSKYIMIRVQITFCAFTLSKDIRKNQLSFVNEDTK